MTQMMNQTPPEELRIDKWLWFARFFKSRSQATTAVAGGLVHVNGQRTKPSYAVHLGDTLAITRGEMRFEVIIHGLPSRRGPAAQAQEHYVETPGSAARREQRRLNAQAMPTSQGRPDKHDRRTLRSLRGRN